MLWHIVVGVLAWIGAGTVLVGGLLFMVYLGERDDERARARNREQRALEYAQRRDAV